MNIQIFLYNETFRTEVAGKVPGGGVSGRVFGQGGESGKRFAADTALVGPLAGVIIHVLHQVELVNKSLPAYSANMRPLQSVLLHFVSVEVSVLVELSVALLTLEWFLLLVRDEMFD